MALKLIRANLTPTAGGWSITLEATGDDGQPFDLTGWTNLHARYSEAGPRATRMFSLPCVLGNAVAGEVVFSLDADAIAALTAPRYPFDAFANDPSGQMYKLAHGLLITPAG